MNHPYHHTKIAQNYRFFPVNVTESLLTIIKSENNSSNIEAIFLERVSFYKNTILKASSMINFYSYEKMIDEKIERMFQGVHRQRSLRETIKVLAELQKFQLKIEKIEEIFCSKFYNQREFQLVFDSAFLKPANIGISNNKYPLKYTFINRMNVRGIYSKLTKIFEFFIDKFVRNVIILNKQSIPKNPETISRTTKQTSEDFHDTIIKLNLNLRILCSILSFQNRSGYTLRISSLSCYEMLRVGIIHASKHCFLRPLAFEVYQYVSEMDLRTEGCSKLKKQKMSFLPMKPQMEDSMDEFSEF